MQNELRNRIQTLKHTPEEATKPEPPKVFGLYPKGFLSLLASPPGIGKTWVTLYMAAKGSIGEDIFGEKTKPIKTVLLSGETGVDMLIRRLKKTDWRYDPKNLSMYSAFEMNMAGINTSINVEEGRSTLLAIIQEENPDVIIFDTLIAFHGNDESDQKEMTRVYLYLCKLAITFNVAVILNHHTRKRSQNNPHRLLAQDDVIGSSSSIRLASSIFLLQTDEENQGVFTLVNVKSWGRKVPAIKFAMSDEEDMFSFSTTFSLGTGSQRKKIQDCVYAYGFEGSLFRPKEMAIKLNMAEKTVRRYLSELTQPNEDDGTILLKQISVSGENMFVGVLPVYDFCRFKANHNITIDKQDVSYTPKSIDVTE